MRAWRGGTGHWGAHPRSSHLPTTSCPGAPTSSSLRIHQTYSGTGSSYLLIPHDKPDLLRYRKFLPPHPSGYTRPTQVQQLLPSHPSGYTRPTQVQTYSGTVSSYLLKHQDTQDLLMYRTPTNSFLRIHQTY